MHPVNVDAMQPATRCRSRRRCVLLASGVGVLLLAPHASAIATAGAEPSKDKIRICVVADAGRAAQGRAVRQADIDESANDLRKRAKGLDLFHLVDRAEDADLVVTVTSRRQDPDKGYVLSYILEAGAYKVEDEFAVTGGTEITGGTRALSSDGRTNYEGRRTLSWDELSKQFAKSLEAFAKANHDRMLRQREQRKPQ